MDANNKVKALTVVIAALNEQATIGTMVSEIVPVARRVLDDFEILLVDDGSTDRTGSADGRARAAAS